MQGACGSCWAFAAVASLEIRNTLYSSTYRTLKGNNFSEQQLLSCNPDGFSCQGGFIVTDAIDTKLGNAGIVNEEDFPYAGQKIPCIFNLLNFIPSQGYRRISPFARALNSTDSSQIASESEIKRVVYTYGSVWTTIYADDAFQGYKSGVFNACRTNLRAGEINHAVNIVGWDDAGGYWIVRNSWDTSWGENGYARVRYGCNNLGSWSYKYDLQSLYFENFPDGSLRLKSSDILPSVLPWLLH
jgi:C1A family cysteine protease